MTSRAFTAKLVAGVLVAFAIVGTIQDAARAEPPRRGGEPRASLVLSLATRAAIGRLEAVLPDPGLAHPLRKPVMDLVVILSADAGGIDAALTLINGVPREARLFRARLIAAVGGRIYARATALCGGWQGDVSTCRVACDGGAFALRRSAGEEPKLSLVIGHGAADDTGGEAQAGVRISACDAEAAEVRLAPLAAGRATELELSPE